MEDVLSVYTLPYDPRYPVVCFDETIEEGRRQEAEGRRFNLEGDSNPS
jgi:hypothetical protein